MSNEKTAKPCIWNEVIYENKGPMTFEDRDISSGPNFSQFMLEEMLGEVRRLVDKYIRGLTMPMPIVLCSFFRNTSFYFRPRLMTSLVVDAHFRLKISLGPVSEMH
jgi:hypothetical protein